MNKVGVYRIGSVEEITIPRCLDCKHYYGEGLCGSFLEGIPEDIYNNNILHNREMLDQKRPFVFERKIK